MRKIVQLKPINSAILFFVLALLIGGYIRLNGAFTSPFPLNDGGLFYNMTEDLISNQFAIPSFTSYNQANIPFAYPPLAFYLTGWLTTIFNWDLLDIFLFFPAVFCVLTIPAFFFFAKEFIQDDLQVGIATLIFSVLPNAFDLLIMGGGVTRAPAFFFAIITIIFINRLYRTSSKKYVFLTAIIASLTVLTHPESALHTAASALVFFLFFGRNKTGIIKTIVVSFLVLAITSPWWVNILSNHGIAPFLAAAKTGWHDYRALAALLLFDLTSETNVQSISVLSMIGLFWYVARKDFFLPTLFLVIYVSEPRSAPLFLSPLFAVFSALVIVNLLSMFNSGRMHEDNKPLFFKKLPGKIGLALLLIFTIQWIYSSSIVPIITTRSLTISEADEKAFNWISEQTSPESRFIVLTGVKPQQDWVSEWFPALSHRNSANSVQGYEWVSKTKFERYVKNAEASQECYNKTPSCIMNWITDNQLEIDYVMIRSFIPTNDVENVVLETSTATLFTLEGNKIVYQTPEILILRLKSP